MKKDQSKGNSSFIILFYLLNLLRLYRHFPHKVRVPIALTRDVTLSLHFRISTLPHFAHSSKMGVPIQKLIHSCLSVIY